MSRQLRQPRSNLSETYSRPGSLRYGGPIVRTGSERNAEGDTHPGEDILSLAFEQALTGNELSRVEQRLGNCWNCRARPEEMNRGILAFIDYRENRYLPSIPVPTGDFPDFGPAFGVWNPRLLQRWNWCIVAKAALRSDLSNLVVASKTNGPDLSVGVTVVCR